MTRNVMNALELLKLPPCDVLIIEDEPLVQALLSRYMSQLPKTPIFSALKSLPKSLEVQSLDRGWELLKTDLSGVRVAIVDILLPQVTGVDLIRDFRKRFPSIGIVPISGMATEPMKRSLKEVLPEGLSLLPKPLRKEEFYEAFAKAWNFSFAFQHQQPVLKPVQEAGEELWTAVPVQNTNQVSPTVERRGLSRKKSAA